MYYSGGALRRGERCGVLEHGQDEGRDLLELSGFVKEVEGAQRRTNRAVGFVGLVADHDHGHTGVAFADDAEELDAAFVRQVDIEEEDIGRIGIDHGERFAVATGIGDLFGGKQTIQHAKQPLDDERRVIDDE